MSTRSQKHDVSQGALSRSRSQELLQALAQERFAYSMAEAAALLGITERYLWKLAKQGVVPVVHLGGRTLVRKATLERALAEREGRPQSTAQLRVMK